MADFLLIGEKLEHSFSKTIHEQLNMYDYDLLEINHNDLEKLFSKKEFKGLNVTIPYKEKCIKYLNNISKKAKTTNAVNTIINFNNELFGFNSDYYGLKSLLEKNSINVKNKKVLILGTGGTSKTAKCLVEDLGARIVFRVSRNKITQRTNSIIDIINNSITRNTKKINSNIDEDTIITYDEMYEECSNFDIIINATPVGMYPRLEENLVDINKFSKLETVVDVVYNPLNTLIIQEANKRKIKAVNGLFMLVMQAIVASYFFNLINETHNENDIKTKINNAILENEEFTKELECYLSEKKQDIINIYETTLEQKRNYVLIGMPGVGKTTYGMKFAKDNNKEFIDTDKLIEEKTKKKTKDIILENGEEYFRNIESEIIDSLINKNNAVIATGGGVILRNENITKLKYNGVVLYLEKDINEIEISNERPLADTKEKLTKIYNERISKYNEVADYVIKL